MAEVEQQVPEQDGELARVSFPELHGGGLDEVLALPARPDEQAAKAALESAAARSSGAIRSLMEELSRALEAHPDSHAGVLSFPPGADFSEIRGKLQSESSANSLVVLSGELALSTKCGERGFPKGYCIINASPLLDGDRRLDARAGDQGIVILSLQRGDLLAWIKENERLRGAINDGLSEMYPALPMPGGARERIRHARDQNIMALVTREAISTVNRAGGVLEILNPAKLTYESRDGAEARGEIEQTWRLVRAIAPVTLHMEGGEILEMARAARKRAEGLADLPEAIVSELATWELMRVMAVAEEEMLEKSCPLLSIALQLADYSEQERQVLTERTLQVRWLDKRIRQHTGESAPGAAIWDDIIGQELKDAGSSKKEGYARVLQALDERLETLFDYGRERGVPELTSIAFTKYAQELDVSDPACEELPADHTSHRAIADLQRRLERGETSAVGGSAYAEMRFPRETLEAVATGEAPVVFFDGDREGGIRFLRERFGRSEQDPSLLQPCTVMELQGAYGSFSRSWVFFRDGRSAVLVSYLGEARQLSNAAAMLLFEDEAGREIGPASMVLAREKRPVSERLHGELERLLEWERHGVAGTEVLGARLDRPEQLPTQVLIIQHPDQLVEALGEDVVMHEFKTNGLGSVYLGYWRSPSGELTRLLVPKVGSSGLYGDTAGEFLKVVFERDLVPNLVPDVLFTGTAGAFDGPNSATAPGMKPGDLFTPLQGVSDAQGAIRMRSLLNGPAGQDEKLRAALAGSRVHTHALHHSVGAPALETFELIDELVVGGHGSIDVESGPIMRAVEEVAKRTPEVTFTPIYYFSDNPLEARLNPSNTLAYGGPLAEGSKKTPELYAAVKALMVAASHKRG